MDKQAIFNTVAKAFLVDGHPQGFTNGECQYRAPGGGKCAIGVLLPDAICNPEFLEEYNVGCGVAQLLASVPEVASYFGIEREEVDKYMKAVGRAKEREEAPNVSFLAELQSAHDVAADSAADEEDQDLAFRDKIRLNLEGVAARFSLSFTSF